MVTDAALHAYRISANLAMQHTMLAMSVQVYAGRQTEDAIKFLDTVMMPTANKDTTFNIQCLASVHFASE
eukprot:1140788-Pelagomonas_calceolata.AAC.2